MDAMPKLVYVLSAATNIRAGKSNQRRRHKKCASPPKRPPRLIDYLTDLTTCSQRTHTRPPLIAKTRFGRDADRSATRSLRNRERIIASCFLFDSHC